MKARLFVICVVSLMLLCVCGDDPAGPQDGPGEIWPLAVGNTWDYYWEEYDQNDSVVDEGAFAYVVQGDTAVQSETWYILSVGGNPEPALYQNRGDGLWLFWRSLANPGLFALYPADISVQYTHARYDSDITVQVVSVDTTITVSAGTYSCYLYYVKDYDSGEREEEWFLSPDNGLILLNYVDSIGPAQYRTTRRTELTEIFVQR